LQLLTFWGYLGRLFLIQELEDDISVIFFSKSSMKLLLFSYLAEFTSLISQHIKTHSPFLSSTRNLSMGKAMELPLMQRVWGKM
jgi:hypothetical protein